MRSVLRVAFAIELTGFAAGFFSLAWVVRDALRAPDRHVIGATLEFGLRLFAAHAVVAVTVLGAVVLARRVPWLAALAALIPLALAYSFVTHGGYGFVVYDVALKEDAMVALFVAASIHVILAAIACAIALAALAIGLLRRGGAEGGPPVSNGELS